MILTLRRLVILFRVPFLLVAAVAVVAATTAGSESNGYRQVLGPCNLRFPEDHGPHVDYRTEWWYVTGNLRAADGRPLGFQLTFFRNRITPPGAEDDRSQPSSPWRAHQIYLAHAALSDISRGHFLHAERVGRGAMNLAGASQEGDFTRVFLRDWAVEIRPGELRLQAEAPQFAFTLDLAPLKPPVLHGDSGLSRKGERPGRASCYASFTRLAAKGTATVHGALLPVTGTAWMDHEFSSSPLEPGVVGWDWFSLQLSNQTELMLYLLRHEDGSVAPASSGTFVDAAGRSLHLPKESIEVMVTRRWQSPRSKGKYPAQWRVRIPLLELDLTVTPRLEDQELTTPESTRVTYWEGSVTAHGRMAAPPRSNAADGEGKGGGSEAGVEVDGVGYVELTGYDSPLEALKK